MISLKTIKKNSVYHEKKRILVTGGAGFIGSHLCERLLQMGYDVICMDNFYTGSKQNIAHLLENPYFELLRHDITFPVYLEVDEIYNLACPASPIHYQNDPVQTTKVNGQQTRSFCYVNDMVDGLIKMMEGPDEFTGPVNMGNPEEYTIMDLCKYILELAGSKSPIVHKSLPQDDPVRRKPDISLSKEKLGWTPKIGIEKGLRLTIDYFSQYAN